MLFADYMLNWLDVVRTSIKASTVIHYHSVIHKALKKAVKISLIPYNPINRVERPKPEEFTGSFYSVEEVTTLMKAANNTTKNKASRRTLPLLPIVEFYLLNLKSEQQENRKLCGKSYSTEYLDICM